MEGIDKLFDSNNKIKKCKLHNGGCDFICHSKEFGAKEVLDFMAFINGVHKRYKDVNIPIYLNFGVVNIIDKLSYVILECLCYSLIKKYNQGVSISWKPMNNIQTQGIFSSPLVLLNTNKAKVSEKYIKKFESEIYGYHFRKVISVDKEDENYLGILQQDINNFLSTFYIKEDYKDDIVEMIGEVVGNAYEHTKSKCLLDIDVTTDHSKTIKNEIQDGSYYGINIVIINFSDILFGDGIKKRIENNDLKSNERYELLQKAYNYHKDNFSEHYTIDDFCNIASLQHKISGNPNKGKAGGKGLTTLIKSLQERSDNDNCYLLSGKRIISFQKEVLQYDENEWLGFNKQRDFFSTTPCDAAIDECIVFFPGTAYNLNFILKREDGYKHDSN